MYEYDEECLKTFLKNQAQLFDEPVAETLEEAEAFLEDCMAAVVENIDEVKEFRGFPVRVPYIFKCAWENDGRGAPDVRRRHLRHGRLDDRH